MSASVTIYVAEDDRMGFESGTLHIGDDAMLSIEGTELLRRLAFELLTEANRRDDNHAESKRCLIAAAEHVAEIRREKGEIADDGLCWDCKADDHSGHRDYNEGRCYGCGCPAQMETKR